MSSSKQNGLVAIKDQILSALGHPEAEDGLYFENLINLHEDEERIQVVGTEEQVLDALSELMEEELVVCDDSGEKLVFSLK